MKNVANTFRKIYKKTGNSGSDADYELIANVGVNGIDLDIMKGATTKADGEIGLVPKPSAGTINRYLRCDGTWAVPPDTNTTYDLSSFGITATAAEINKLDGLTASKTELNYTDGVTSSIQNQLNNKAASNHSHNGLIAYSSSEVVNTTKGLTWNFYTGLGYRPKCVILTPQFNIGDAYLYYAYDNSTSSYIQIVIWGNPVQGNIRFSIVIPAGA